MRTFAIRWRNFRGFQDSGWVDLRPLTVVIGSNNSGKSSLVKPLLLLKQTLLADTASSGLVLRGPLADVGSYRDAIFRHRSAETLSMGIRYAMEPPGEMPKLGSEPPARLELSFRPSGDVPGRVRLQRYQAYDAWDRMLLSRAFDSTGYTIRMLGRSFSLAEPEAPPERAAYLERLDGAIRTHAPTGFQFRVAPIVEAAFAEGTATPGQVPRQAALYMGIVNHTNNGIRELLTALSYIGPLREPFRRFYEVTGDRPMDVGVSGERAPDIIIARQHDEAFARWLKRWLYAFGFRGGINVPKPHMAIRRINVRTTEKGIAVNIADSGFGLSQVLPFIVQGAHASEGSWLLTEQPEIHLNPRLQLRLADLFAAMVRRGRNVLVETHSEHFLTRIRYLVAIRKLAAEDVALLYVEKHGTHSIVRQVPIDGNGSIPEGAWPQGFFEEALEEAVDLLSVPPHADA